LHIRPEGFDHFYLTEEVRVELFQFFGRHPQFAVAGCPDDSYREFIDVRSMDPKQRDVAT